MLSFTARKRIRNNFGKIENVAEMPGLIEVQKKSFDAFLNKTDEHSKSTKGLEEVFKSVFPINDFAETATIEFVSYEFGQPKYDVEESIQRGINFAAPLKVTLRLIVWLIDEETEAREIKDIKEQEVYLGDIPMMTQHGTFIINGTERVIVSQMHRSPGVFFSHDKGKTHSSGKFLYQARIIPYRGSWLDIEFDAKDHLFFRIDKKRKILISTLLRALGLSTQEILDYYYDKIPCKKAKDGWVMPLDLSKLKGIKTTRDILNAKDGKIILKEGTKITAKTIRDLKKDKLDEQLVDAEHLLGSYVAADVTDKKTGEVILSAGDEIEKKHIADITEAGIAEINLLNIDGVKIGGYIRNSMFADKANNRDEALIDIYKVMRPGEPPTVEAGEDLFTKLFFDEERFDLSEVGRMKTNARLGTDFPEGQRILEKDDILISIKKLIAIKDGFEDVDDIDNLSNRRVRSVGELIENQFRVGLLRMERAITERMAAVDIDSVMPQDLVNAKPLLATIKEFYGGNQLSQFMDQTNPLSEVTHKRRISALGPGGLDRSRAGFEVRDVHVTHYGRICPIETPEGPNIGLINSLATFARVNKYGFIETPYRKMVDGKVSDVVEYQSAIEEVNFTIAQANARLNKDGSLADDLVRARQGGEFIMSPKADIEYIDVAPKQLVSVASALIPFLENDDANRALMGSNMQRQAVPLLKADAPLVGTGMEEVVAKDSGVTIIAKRTGYVDQIDATRIVIRATEKDENDNLGVDIYNLRKFQRSNQDTCINQRPLVNVGQEIAKGDVIADGPSTDLGELALGRNVLCAFMPWNGYNYEDSILLSERIVKDDVFTSIHIEEFEVMARDTKLGPEEITRDIPNVGEDNLRQLDEVGIVHIGAEVKPGAILVGKVTPKSESPMTPEEKLLRAIFGEKAADVRDSSLKLPPGVAGTVVDVRIFNRRGIEKDERALAIESEEIDRLEKDRHDERSIIENYAYSHAKDLIIGQTVSKGTKSLKKGAKVTEESLSEISKGLIWDIAVEDAKVNKKLEDLKKHLDDGIDKITVKFEAKVDKVQAGDDLLPGVLKTVKVFVAVKRKMQPGDKMAGRHGNKGVISRIVPVEDMPHMEDGTPVDIVLNPLGVPSRMNIGQIMETHLGWASHALGRQIGDMLDKFNNGKANDKQLSDTIAEHYIHKGVRDEIGNMKSTELVELAGNLRKGIPFATPVFDGAKEENITKLLEDLGLDGSGQVDMWDGRTGEKFDRQVTVGYIYMLKLHHLVDDKIHARSIGPYSLVTQQPLGGKSHFGGQRFGEMECWALQAYGAAHTLQEMLTVKSDDVVGRTKIYESIVNGDQGFDPGLPESFNVIVKELRSLGLNVELSQSSYDKDEDDGEEIQEAEGESSENSEGEGSSEQEAA